MWDVGIVVVDNLFSRSKSYNDDEKIVYSCVAKRRSDRCRWWPFRSLPKCLVYQTDVERTRKRFKVYYFFVSKIFFPTPAPSLHELKRPRFSAAAAQQSIWLAGRKFPEPMDVYALTSVPFTRFLKSSLSTWNWWPLAFFQPIRYFVLDVSSNNWIDYWNFLFSLGAGKKLGWLLFVWLNAFIFEPTKRNVVLVFHGRFQLKINATKTVS